MNVKFYSILFHNRFRYRSTSINIEDDVHKLSSHRNYIYYTYIHTMKHELETPKGLWGGCSIKEMPYF